jgi:hypothetical protein
MEGGRWVFGVGGRHEENERETRGGGEFIVVLGMRAATGPNGLYFRGKAPRLGLVFSIERPGTSL